MAEIDRYRRYQRAGHAVADGDPSPVHVAALLGYTDGMVYVIRRADILANRDGRLAAPPRWLARCPAASRQGGHGAPGRRSAEHQHCRHPVIPSLTSTPISRSA
jgi:hypothetical protein